MASKVRRVQSLGQDLRKPELVAEQREAHRLPPQPLLGLFEVRCIRCWRDGRYCQGRRARRGCFFSGVFTVCPTGKRSWPCGKLSDAWTRRLAYHKQPVLENISQLWEFSTILEARCGGGERRLAAETRRLAMPSQFSTLTWPCQAPGSSECFPRSPCCDSGASVFNIPHPTLRRIAPRLARGTDCDATGGRISERQDR